MPRRHIETRNIVFHIGAGASESLCMMKAEFPTNGELPIPKQREDRRGTIIQDHDENRLPSRDGGDSSVKDKKQPLFRRPGVVIVAAVLAIVGIAYGSLAMFHSFTHESTDDAFIDVHFVSVAPKIAGRVAVVHVDDNQLVKKGDVLVEIDPDDFQVALAQAKANLAKDKAGQIQSDANEKRAQGLFTRKVISTQERDTNVAASDASKASVAADEAAVEQAQLNLGYTKIKAPIDGYVTKEAVTTGDYVQVGQALMSLVPPRVWVTANFKETQLQSMRPGQPTTISIDAYEERELRGHVDSIQAGSGAAFSLMPPENATGNYVKVVQRVPVKIVLDDQQDPQRVLGPGMSVVPTVFVGGEVAAAWKVASAGIILVVGVIVGAALWIGRVRTRV